jgi:hypothetical protein
MVGTLPIAGITMNNAMRRLNPPYDDVFNARY